MQLRPLSNNDEPLWEHWNCYSGLVEALECCYGPKSVAQMIAGKAVSRAIRRHFLIESALTVILSRHVMGISSDDTWRGDHLSGLDVDQLKSVYSDLISNRDCKHIEEPELSTKVQQMLSDL